MQVDVVTLTIRVGSRMCFRCMSISTGTSCLDPSCCCCVSDSCFFSSPCQSFPLNLLCNSPTLLLLLPASDWSSSSSSSFSLALQWDSVGLASICPCGVSSDKEHEPSACLVPAGLSTGAQVGVGASPTPAPPAGRPSHSLGALSSPCHVPSPALSPTPSPPL